MTTFINYLLADTFWLQVLRFLLGSTLILGSVKLVNTLGLVRQLRLQSLLWKCAVVASLLLLLPMPRSVVPTFAVPDMAGASTLALEAMPRQNQAMPGAPQSSTAFAVESSEAPLSPDLILLLLWASVSCMLIARQNQARKRGMETLADRKAVDAFSPLRRDFVQLCRQHKIFPLPTLSVSHQLRSPVTLPGNEICLPQHMLDSLPGEEMTCVLAHELGHVKNRDLQLLAFMQIVQSLFFFQPLLRTANKELMDLAEFIADQEALIGHQNGDQLANALVNCADHYRQENQLVYGIAMVGKPSRLRSRVEQLVGEGQFKTLQITTPLKILVPLLVIGSALMLPAFAQDEPNRTTASNDPSIAEPIACSVAGYEAIVDQVHAGAVSAAAGLARWENSCGTELGAEIDQSWKEFDLPDHHLWYMANSDQRSSAGSRPTMAFFYRAWIASQTLNKPKYEHEHEHGSDHDSAHAAH